MSNILYLFNFRPQSKSENLIGDCYHKHVGELKLRSSQNLWNSHTGERFESKNDEFAFKNQVAHGNKTKHQNLNDDDDRAVARDEIRKKSKELQHLLMFKKSTPQARNAVREHGNHVPMESSALNRSDIGYVISDNISNGKARKPQRTRRKDKKSREIVVVPDFYAVRGDEKSGAELCEKLFGIVVFQYSNGSVVWQQPPKDSKLVVQSIVEGSRNQQVLVKVQRGL